MFPVATIAYQQQDARLCLYTIEIFMITRIITCGCQFTYVRPVSPTAEHVMMISLVTNAILDTCWITTQVILSIIFQVLLNVFYARPSLGVLPVAMGQCVILAYLGTLQTHYLVFYTLNIANKACMPCGISNCATCAHVSGVLTCLSCVSGSVLDTSASN
jgi:hypothetical protein